jgi:hypothetical protein
VRLRSEGSDALIASATVTYAIPSGAPAPAESGPT